MRPLKEVRAENKILWILWLRGPVLIAEGLVITLTFGMCTPGWPWKMDAWFLDVVEKGAK